MRLLVGVDDLVAAERRRLPEPLPAHLADEGARTWWAAQVENGLVVNQSLVTFIHLHLG